MPLKDPEALKAYRKMYEATRRDKKKRAERLREYRKQNHEHCKKVSKLWRDKLSDEKKQKMADYLREYRKKNPEKVRKLSSDWKKRNRPKVAASARASHKRNPLKRSLLRTRYEAKVNGYKACTATLAEIKAAYDGFCHNPGCRRQAGEGYMKSLCLDHCHVTGKFRGWLCRQCNVALGCMRDSKDIIEGMMRYLEERS